MFIDVKKAHINANCGEEDSVELSDKSKKPAKLKRCLSWNEEGSVRMGGRLRKKAGD